MDESTQLLPKLPALGAADDLLLAQLGVGQPDAVRALEQEFEQLPQVILETGHVIHGGMYARTIFIPAGTALTGAQTQCDNVCVVVGDITVTTDDGPVRLTGHHVIAACAGRKRVGIAHADTWWTTLMSTDLTSVQAIEDYMVTEGARLQTRRLATIEGEGAACRLP